MSVIRRRAEHIYEESVPDFYLKIETELCNIQDRYDILEDDICSLLNEIGDIFETLRERHIESIEQGLRYEQVAKEALGE